MRKAEKFIRKWYWLILVYGFIIITRRFIESFNSFYNHIGDFGTDKEWKFYFSLIALGIDFSFFLISIVTLVILFIYRDKLIIKISEKIELFKK